MQPLFKYFLYIAKTKIGRYTAQKKGTDGLKIRQLNRCLECMPRTALMEVLLSSVPVPVRKRRFKKYLMYMLRQGNTGKHANCTKN
jgi:hypothetical protein